jgi:peptidoglycan/LPS O-acetylase OafA/YrhL
MSDDHHISQTDRAPEGTRPAEHAVPENPEGLTFAQDTQGGLGRFLDAQLAPGRTRSWRNFLFAVLAVIAVLGLVVTNHHPHFGYDAYPFFWPVFGLAAGLALIFIVKKIIQPVIKRTEDHYGDL